MQVEEKQDQIRKFLDKNYLIREGKFFTRYDDTHEWGDSIEHYISRVFSFDDEFCNEELKSWGEANGLIEGEWKLAYVPIKLNTKWSVEMAQDLQMLHGINNAEEQVVSLLILEVAREIDSDILRFFKDKVRTHDEVISIIKCIGYEPTQIIYNQHNFKPYRGFISMNHNDIKNERDINPYWQNWIRTRK